MHIHGIIGMLFKLPVRILGVLFLRFYYHQHHQFPFGNAELTATKVPVLASDHV